MIVAAKAAHPIILASVKKVRFMVCSARALFDLKDSRAHAEEIELLVLLKWIWYIYHSLFLELILKVRKGRWPSKRWGALFSEWSID